MPLPTFEDVAILGNTPSLIAEIASWFQRDSRYLTVLDAPRLTRPDWTNEVARRHNALSLAQPHRLVFAGANDASVARMIESGVQAEIMRADNSAEAAQALRGLIAIPQRPLDWGRNDLGIGLMLARQSGSALNVDENRDSPCHDMFVSAGREVLIACEAGNELSQIVASNLAFATGASLLILPRLSDPILQDWMEALYAIGSDGGNATEQLREIRARARTHIPQVHFDHFGQITFITHGFPWGLAVPERPTTHLYDYPDLGRTVVEGLWVAANPPYAARSALLVEPGEVNGSEIQEVAQALLQNRTLARTLAGPAASVNAVDVLAQGLPFDVMVFSTHAGDASGERVTYAYTDSEGIPRRLVVDEARGIAYDPVLDEFRVEQHERFHALDGILWSDRAEKDRMYIGTAITTWAKIGDIAERKQYQIASERIERVVGSMGLKMYDDVWFASIHGFAPVCFPAIVCNACSSWHELSRRLSFAGARAYVGTLHPVTNVEAQEVVRYLFGRALGRPLIEALWEAQNEVYGAGSRRPYVMFGLPFSSVPQKPVPSMREAVLGMGLAYQEAVDSYQEKIEEQNHPGGFVDVARNCHRYRRYLMQDFQMFCTQFIPRKPASDS